MAAVSWKTGISGDLSVPSNWPRAIVSDSSSDVTIAVGGSYTVTISGSRSAHSLNLFAAGVTLAIDAESAVATSFARTSGTVGGVGTATVSGAANLTGDAESCSGISVFEGRHDAGGIRPDRLYADV